MSGQVRVVSQDKTYRVELTTDRDAIVEVWVPPTYRRKAHWRMLPQSSAKRLELLARYAGATA